MSSPFVDEHPREGAGLAVTPQSSPITGTPSTRPRIVYFGTRSIFSRPPLQRLLTEGHEVVAVVVPGREGIPVTQRMPPTWALSSLPLLGSAGSILEIAWEHGVPVLEVGNLANPEVAAALTAVHPDVLAVACFPLRLPRAVLSLPTLAAVNLHPSLLPRHRGPNPIFWALREGDPLGVSVHLMTDRLDQGPVLAQETVPAPDGAMSAQLDLLHSSVGANLMVHVIQELWEGIACPRAQDEWLASYERWPEPEHFAVPTTWTARRAFNFIRGAGHIGVPVVETGQRHLPVASALNYDETAVMPAEYERRNGTARIRFSQGILEVALLER